MIIFPAIDLFEKKAVRLLYGDYKQMTVYSDSPTCVAADFKRQGATHIHIVDLEGAKTGETPNLGIVEEIIQKAGLFAEVGGGIRNIETVKAYLSVGVSRVILGTSAVTDENFLRRAIADYGEKIAVGADVKNGCIATHGWLSQSQYTLDEFLERMQSINVKTIICTDISKDGAMLGANRELYARLMKKYKMDIIASGGVSSIDDVLALKQLNVHGAIIGKAYYIGAINLKEAIEVAK